MSITQTMTKPVQALPSWRQILSVVAFPTVFGSAMAVGIAYVGTDFSELVPAWLGSWLNWNETILYMLIMAPVIVIIGLLERINPQYDSWNQSHDDIGTDIAHVIVTNNVVIESAKVLLFGFSLAVAGYLTEAIGFGLWPTSWPIWIQLFLAAAIGEFGQYWMHRLGHEWEPVWRLHATHHSAPRLYWLNAARFHPLDLLLQYGAGYVIVLALGCPLQVVFLYTLFSSVHGLFQHSNMRLKLGFLNYIFSMAELHRWHHSRNIEEANQNYGANIILWDMVFGTRYLPEDRQPPEDIGIYDMPRFPQTFTGQMLSPFRWNKLH